MGSSASGISGVGKFTPERINSRGRRRVEALQVVRLQESLTLLGEDGIPLFRHVVGAARGGVGGVLLARGVVELEVEF